MTSWSTVSVSSPPIRERTHDGDARIRQASRSTAPKSVGGCVTAPDIDGRPPGSPIASLDRPANSGTRAKVASRPSCGSATISFMARNVAAVKAWSAAVFGSSVSRPTTSPGPGSPAPSGACRLDHSRPWRRSWTGSLVTKSGGRIDLTLGHGNALTVVRVRHDLEVLGRQSFGCQERLEGRPR